MVKVALLIGVSEYEQGLKPLPRAARDVEAMQRVLQHVDMGGFAEVDITVLINRQRQEIEDAIYNLFANRQKDDLLLFYFSGHGITEDSGEFYLSTRSTREDEGKLVPPTAVAASYIHGRMNSSKSRRQVVILDCCFSGAFAKGMTAKDAGTVDVNTKLGGEGRAILTASTSTQNAFEQEGFHLSIYTHFLVEGIEKGVADRDNDGWVSVDELYEYVKGKVKETSPAMTPEFYPVKEGHKILLAKSPKDDPRLKYRKEAESRANQGKFSVIARRILNLKRNEWGLSAEEVTAIEEEVLRPYQEYERKRDEYEQALNEVVKQECPFSEATQKDLKDYQQYLGLRDEDIASIEERVLAPKQPEYERSLQEAERLRQEQEKAKYENNLRQYEQEFSKAVRAGYPLSQSVQEPLKSLRQSLGLKGEHITLIEQPILEQAEARYQEKLREAQRQRELEQPQAEALKRQQELERQEALERQRQAELARQDTDDLSSEKGVDYTRLQDLLKAGQWKEANQETLDAMLKAAGCVWARWLDSESIKSFPCTDLRTIDQLWVKYSKGHFGFSVQKRIFDSVNQDLRAFGSRVGWRGKAGVFGGVFALWKTKDELTFSLVAPEGHLPWWGVWWGTWGALGENSIDSERRANFFLSRRDL